VELFVSQVVVGENNEQKPKPLQVPAQEGTKKGIISTKRKKNNEVPHALLGKYERKRNSAVPRRGPYGQ